MQSHNDAILIFFHDFDIFCFAAAFH